MELLFIILLASIFAETSYLTIKNIKKSKKSDKRRIYVDTSALIDGRILSVARTGFLGDDLVIPRSVIHELQLLADGKDSEKRARARFGLDNINELERVVLTNVIIEQDELDRTPVDDRLIDLAKKNRDLILTTDFNLNKVATAENIDVLNINDLALALRTEFLPGDKLKIQITDKGSNPNQGVGHLPDGTMVVVDKAASRVGQDVEIEFVRFLQTSAGRMMFAKLASARRATRRTTPR